MRVPKTKAAAPCCLFDTVDILCDFICVERLEERIAARALEKHEKRLRRAFAVIVRCWGLPKRREQAINKDEVFITQINIFKEICDTMDTDTIREIFLRLHFLLPSRIVSREQQ